MISCLMPTYNRFPKNKHLVNEAIQSFLLQDYKDKELIVCNDTPGQKLIGNFPNVKIFNVEERFPTLSDKLTWMIDKAKGDILCRWDDDDICLPHRLSLSMEKLGDGLEWKAANYWYCPLNDVKYVEHPGNTHCMAVWRREVLDLIGGYPPKASGWEDQAFNHKIFNAGISDWLGEVLPAEEIFYLYRWGVSDRHLSGTGGGNNGMQNHYDNIGSMPIAKDLFYLDPEWEADYLAKAAEGLFLYRKETPIDSQHPHQGKL